MSYQSGVSGVHQADTRFKVSASTGSEATQEMSQSIPNLVATCQAPTDFYSGMGC